MAINKFSTLLEKLDESEKEITREIKSMIEKTIETSGGEYRSFIKSYLKDPESVKINGLINDSDIYEFYLKYRNQIDKNLNDIKFYDEIPSELNVNGLYDYIIKGSMRSVLEFIKNLG